MQLRLCLLACFLFNVFSLKDPSDKILSPKNHSSSESLEILSLINHNSSESLVESLKKDPLSFVEAFAQADPDKVNALIDLLKNLAAASLSNKQKLVSKKESADAELIAAQVAKDDADSNLAAQGPGLDDEHTVIQKVIKGLRGLIPCSDGYKTKKGSDGFSACYKYVDSKVSWVTARDACVADEAHLVIATSANYEFLHSTNDCVWTGGNDIDVEGSWVWTDGTPITETHWNTNTHIEPNGLRNENCIMTLDCEAKGLDNWWNDQGCEANLNYVCQK